ncbi:MAG: hypothetical protein CM15mV8_0390 [Caudoviricetes sp.]|nr:MAG: hypothetical protein CM15mV8_0390 [Caudoviricetes sp.]
MYDLNKIKEEIKTLLNGTNKYVYKVHLLLKIICVLARLKIYTEEKEFIYHYLIYLTSILLLKNIIYIELIKKLKSKTCYSWHYDQVKRLHILLLLMSIVFCY